MVFFIIFSLIWINLFLNFVVFFNCFKTNLHFSFFYHELILGFHISYHLSIHSLQYIS